MSVLACCGCALLLAVGAGRLFAEFVLGCSAPTATNKLSACSKEECSPQLQPKKKSSPTPAARKGAPNLQQRSTHNTSKSTLTGRKIPRPEQPEA